PLAFGQLPGEVGALGYRDVAALPNMVVLVRLHSQAVLALLLKLRREPRVVPPVRLDHNCARWRFLAPEQHVYRVRLAAGVPAEPQLRPRRADRGPQQTQAMRRGRLRLLPP